MNKRRKSYLLSMFFKMGLSEKVAPFPKWYPYVVFLIFGIIITGVINLFKRQIVIGLLSFIVAFGIYYFCYIYRKQKVLKAIRNIKPEELEDLFSGIQQDRSGKAYFPTCKKCGKETSRAGNITNMILSGIINPDEFNQHYGMMCAQHTVEITEKITQERNLTPDDIAKANMKALQVIAQELSNL